MIQPLLAEVERLRGVLNENGAALKASEAATRYAVIDPTLKLLGWDVHDPATVRPEHKAGTASNARVDYALYRAGKPAVFLEAKPYGTSLQDKELEQLSNYCTNIGVRWGVLTNGGSWKLLDARMFGQPLSEKVVRDFTVTDGTAIQALHDLLALFALIAGKEEPGSQPTQPPKPGPSIAPPKQAGDDLTALAAAVVPGKRCAYRLQFPGGIRAEVTKWSSVLQSVIEWLDSQGKLPVSVAPLADHAGKGRHLVSSGTTHPNGTPFKNPRRLASGLYYQTNYSATDTCRNALHALEACGVDPHSVTVESL